jgi:uncharacterized membrane protein
MTRLETAIGSVLRFGTIASSALFAVGLVVTLTGYSGEVASLLLNGALVILLATPVTRVIVSAVEFARSRDWVFVVLTLVVLLALAGSLFAAYE